MSGATGKTDDLTALLPGYNCGACGAKRCDELAAALASEPGRVESCPFLKQERFAKNRLRLLDLLALPRETEPERELTGLLDGYRADFELNPLPGEPSCRETLFPFARRDFNAGDVIRYRPMGCPMIHFAKILSAENGLITVHLVGPAHRVDDPSFAFEDVGVCMVGGFEGIVEGKLPFVGQTVRFIPNHCMMRKVHTGAVVQLIGNRISIEGIDLKVWSPPE